MSDLTYNHITVRVPGTDTFLINLYGLLYKEVTASSLAKVDLDGNVVWKPEGTDYGVNAAGYVIHSAIHAARDDIGAVIHTHSLAGMAVAAMKSGLLPLSQHSMRFNGHLAYHDYEGPALSEQTTHQLNFRPKERLDKHRSIREGGCLQDWLGIADASEFAPAASFAMNGRFVT